MIPFLDLRNGMNESFFEKLNQRNQLEHENVNIVVAEVVKRVKSEGNSALLAYTERFDGIILMESNIEVTQNEIDSAFQQVDPALLAIIRRAKSNIECFHQKQLEKYWFTNDQEGILLGQIIRPLETVGVYSPGGTAAYPSSVLMNVVPAKVAGVQNVIMVTPPKKEGINPLVLVAAREAGVDRIFKVGGAHAIAALAFGTQSIPAVDKIMGPGNIYVNTAKRMVFGYCDIDMFAGPSEITIVADETADSRFVAADLMSQAEHDVLASSILVTTSMEIANQTQAELKKQVQKLSRKEIIQKSLADYGAVMLVNTLDEAITIVNKIAPEHLELCVKDPFDAMGMVKNAGAIFLGNYASEPLGDYYAGPNHVLPTSGTARFFSPLNISDFMKKSSVISYSKKALEKSWQDIAAFADSEGLSAHANAIRIRFEAEGKSE